MHNSRSRLAILPTLIALSSVAIGAIDTPMLAKSKVPMQTELKARVRKLYAIGPISNLEQLQELLPLMPPFVSECPPSDDELLGDKSAPEVKVLSWKIAKIEYDPIYVNENLKCHCTGHTDHFYHVEAGAVVTILQRDQENHAKPQRGELYQRWILIGGTWYFAEME